MSIVTPTLNTGRYLEETIQSVVAQDYPRVEYLVMDGGSTDGTLDILERYRERLRYVSGRDGGQADAVNRGFARTHGEIVAFLNADDTYLPGAITAAVRAFASHPHAGVVYGEGVYVDAAGATLARYPVERFDPAVLGRRCIICQPAAFIRRRALQEIGGLDPTLRFALDYDLWIRLARRFDMARIDRRLATLRLHGEAKTVRETGPAMRETIDVLRRHYGYVPYNWLYGYVHHARTGYPVTIEPPPASMVSACLAAVIGARFNWRQPVRFSRDILGTARQRTA